MIMYIHFYKTFSCEARLLLSMGNMGMLTKYIRMYAEKRLCQNGKKGIDSALF